jgi:large subunit ribosomal protein L4
MPEVKYRSKDGAEVKTIALEGLLFNSEPKEHVLHEYVIGFLRNQRQGNSSVLNRSRMKGGGKKPFKQKGTGRARAGSNTSPLWSGGAVAWGPTPKDHYAKLPKALKRSAINSAFSLRAKEGNLQVVELPEFAEAKTKLIANFLKVLGVYNKKTLLLYEGKNDNLTVASRNIKNFSVVRASQVNPYDLLWHEQVLITEDGLERVKEMFKND